MPEWLAAIGGGNWRTGMKHLFLQLMEHSQNQIRTHLLIVFSSTCFVDYTLEHSKNSKTHRISIVDNASRLNLDTLLLPGSKIILITLIPLTNMFKLKNLHTKKKSLLFPSMHHRRDQLFAERHTFHFSENQRTAVCLKRKLTSFAEWVPPEIWIILYWSSSWKQPNGILLLWQIGLLDQMRLMIAYRLWSQLMLMMQYK